VVCYQTVHGCGIDYAVNCAVIYWWLCWANAVNSQGHTTAGFGIWEGNGLSRG
jgi:hypothetical protein